MREPELVELFTVEEYLERKWEVRHEYVDGEVFEMEGPTIAHEVIAGNLFNALMNHLRGSECRAYVGNMKVFVESSNSIYYPDVMVSCEPLVATDVYTTAPVLLVEVLSPSTKQTDRREKWHAYRRLPSLREYVLIHQDSKRIELFRRLHPEQWSISLFFEHDILVLESLRVPLSLPVKEIYRDLSNLSPYVSEGDRAFYASRRLELPPGIPRNPLGL